LLLDNLSTDRLEFRRLSLADKTALMEFYGDSEVTKYYMFEHDPETNCTKGIEKQLWRYKTYNVGMAGLIAKANNKLIGMCGLLHQNINDQLYLEVGYGLMKQYWGNGYAIEAAKYCRDYAFKNKMADVLISIIHPDNISSQKVASKNGMTINEKLEYKGHLIYQLSKEVWGNL